MHVYRVIFIVTTEQGLLAMNNEYCQKISLYNQEKKMIYKRLFGFIN